MTVVRADVEAEAVLPGATVAKIFHYEDGEEYVNALAENGVTLAEVWPGLYAVDTYGLLGFNLTLLDETGKVTREYTYDEERPETNRYFFPAANGEYYLLAGGNSGGWEYRGDPFERTYYDKSGKSLWRDDGTGVDSGGLVCLSPDGERVVYVQGDTVYTRADSKTVFRDPSGQKIAVETIPFLGEDLNFTVDGDYFLASESFRSGRESDFGTAVFDKDGRLLFFLEPDLQACISWGRSRSALGGGKGYLYQIGFKVERTESDGRVFISDRLFDIGRLLQIYDSNGNKLREYQVSMNLWGAGVSPNGELIAFVPAEPGNEMEVTEIATGDHVNTFKLTGIKPSFPVITLSNNGDTVCVSEIGRAAKFSRTWNSWATIYSNGGARARFKADNSTGAFHLSPDGKYAVFCGARTLAVFAVRVPE
jgi:hypothetical protein